MCVDRRAFIKQLSLGGIGTVLLGSVRPGLAFGDLCSGGKTLVHIWLGGGAASHLLLAPHASSSAFSSYAEANPKSGVGVGANPLGLPITGGAYAMRPTLTALQAAVNDSLFGFKGSLVNYVGYPNRNYSHEESSNIIQLGTRNYIASGTGWAGRLADSLCEGREFSVIGFSGRTPVIRSQVVEPLFIDSLDSFSYSGDSWDGHGALARDVFAKIRGVAGENVSDRAMKQAFSSMEKSVSEMRRIREAYAADTNTASYPKDDGTLTKNPDEMNYFARRLRDASVLIRSNRAPQFVSLELSGWDTHSDANLRINELTTELNLGLRSFCQDLFLGGKSSQVTIIIHSEFGRRSFENDSEGQDHGHGGMVVVLDAQARGAILGPSQYSPIDFYRSGVSGGSGEIPGGYGYEREDGSFVAGIDFREVLEQVISHAGFDSSRVFSEQFERSGIRVFV